MLEKFNIDTENLQKMAGGDCDGECSDEESRKTFIRNCHIMNCINCVHQMECIETFGVICG